MSTTADKPTGPAFVVFGIGADKKPRAARFDDSQPKLLAKAAVSNLYTAGNCDEKISRISIIGGGIGGLSAALADPPKRT